MATAENEEIQFLTKLGLNASQARVYLTLAELNRATARTIACSSKLARQEVYRVLGELENEGLVERILANPTEFRSFSIEASLGMLIERQKSKISGMEEKANKLVQRLTQRNLNPIQEEHSQFVVINEKGHYVQKARKLVTDAQISVDVISTLDRWMFFTTRFEAEIIKSLRKGVKHRIIIEKPDGDKTIPESANISRTLLLDPNYAMKFLHTIPRAVMLIIDNKETNIVTSERKEMDESTTLWTNNQIVAGILREYFDVSWSEAADSKLD